MAKHKFSRTQWEQIQLLAQRAQQTMFVVPSGVMIDKTEEEEFTLEWDEEKVSLDVSKPKDTEEETNNGGD